MEGFELMFYSCLRCKFDSVVTLFYSNTHKFMCILLAGPKKYICEQNSYNQNMHL